MAGYDHSVYMLISCVRQCMVYNNLVIVFVYGRGFHIGSCGFKVLVIADVILNYHSFMCSKHVLSSYAWELRVCMHG